MMSFYSDDVTVTFYEKLLGKQVADAPEDKIMLDIIWDSVCSDFGLNYSHMSETLDRVIYMVPNLTHANTTESLASYVQSVEKGCDKALSAFFKKLQILKEKSPSCGCGRIYDGTHTGTLTEGNGCTAALFLKNGIDVTGESDIGKKFVL